MPAEQAKNVVESFESKMKEERAEFSRELATRSDLEKVRTEMEKMRGELTAKIEAVKSDILRWYVTGLIAQTIAIGYFILRMSSN